MKKIVYVTGCLGFIGYHVAHMCLYAGFYVIGVDKKTYASNLNLLPNLQKFGKQFKFIESDINDLENLYDCDYIINTAAETHVDNSIVNSDVFVRSNINGVHHLLKLIRQHSTMPILLHFSTDEVYGDIDVGSHTEEDLLKPSNPYSATKAAADMLVLAWARTYGVPYIIVRPTNNYGIGQYVEKLIPKTCKYLSLGRKIPLHQAGTPRRTWLHASDTANAINTLIKNGIINEIYNISGNYEEHNIEIVKKIIKIFHHTDDYKQYVDLRHERQGQDVRYSINDNKLKALGWFPKTKFNEKLPEIIEYYKNNFIW